MDLTEVRHFEQQTGTLRLSDAIRIGAKIRGQCADDYFSNGKSCALGAAWEAITGDHTNQFLTEEIRRIFDVPLDILDNIAYRNDAGLTREECADYAESLGF